MSVATAMAKLILENLTKRFGHVPAVDGLHLRVADGELMVLVGPSGCGKTTTLRMIAGLEAPDAGSIHIGECCVDQLAPKDRHVAMVFQSYALYPHMNVFKNLAFALRMQRVGSQEMERRVTQAARMLGIADILDRMPNQLSGGQQQRVALGRAVVSDADVLLLDEPLSNLDARLRMTMRTELVQLQQHLQRTMLHVTHDQVEAMMMGHRVAIMNQGRIQQVGCPRELYDRPFNRFVAEFFGSPPMNILRGILQQDPGGPQVDFGSFRLPACGNSRSVLDGWDGRPIDLGIRPEDILLSSADSAGLTRLSATVRIVQPLGAETLLNLQCSGHELVARAAPRTVVQRGDQLDVHLRHANCHLFHPETGERLELSQS